MNPASRGVLWVFWLSRGVGHEVFEFLGFLEFPRFSRVSRVSVTCLRCRFWVGVEVWRGYVRWGVRIVFNERSEQSLFNEFANSQFLGHG
jgi:hypothetical protein